MKVGPEFVSTNKLSLNANKNFYSIFFYFLFFFLIFIYFGFVVGFI